MKWIHNALTHILVHLVTNSKCKTTHSKSPFDILLSLVFECNKERIKMTKHKTETKRNEEFVSNNFKCDWMVKEERHSTIYHRKIPNRKTHSTRYSLSLHETFAQARQTWYIGTRRALSVLGYVVCLQSLFRLAHFLCSFFCLFVSCFSVRKNDVGNSIQF